MMGAYYFITYITRRLRKQFVDSTVIDEHPFLWLKRSQSESNAKIVLVNWREICEDEYHMYNEEYADQLEEAIASQPSPLEMISRDPSDGLIG
jgi:hypothetical protein